MKRNASYFSCRISRWTPIQFAFSILMLTSIAQFAGAAFGFSTPSALNSNAATDSEGDCNACMASDQSGIWISAWHSTKTVGGASDDLDIWFSVSTNNGASWSPADALNNDAVTDTAYDQHPSVAGDGSGNWVAVWTSNNPLSGTYGLDDDILVARSSDDGATWSDPAALNSNATTDILNDNNVEVITDRAGHWLAVWQTGGIYGYDRDISMSRSSDNGATWSEVELLNSTGATDTIWDQDPHVATLDGLWVAVWAALDTSDGPLGDDGDILFARSTNNGVTWTAPATLNLGADSDEASDFEPAVAIANHGACYAVWSSYADETAADADIYWAYSSQAVSWSGQLPANTDAATDTRNDTRPRIVATDQDDTLFVVWDALDQGSKGAVPNSDVFVTNVRYQKGWIWAPPKPITTYAYSDKGDDWYPQLATDRNRHWVAVWESKDPLRHTIGKDADILFSTSYYPGEIEVIKPNGGETFALGVKAKVRWITQLWGNDRVRIELWRKGKLARVLEEYINVQDVACKVKFPTSLKPGGGYSIRIVLEENETIYDESDEPFSLE